VSRMDGGEYTVFDRSVLVSNGAVHEQVSFKKQFVHLHAKNLPLRDPSVDYAHCFIHSQYAGKLNP
jgi:hypothetical protein